MKEDCKTSTKKKTSHQKLNQWLKTYKMNLINQKTNKQKVLNFVLLLGRSQSAKNAPKLSRKYLKDRMCKIKQYLNYMLMIINQNILAILRTYLNLEKKNMKSPTPSKLPQLLLLNFLTKLPTEKIYIMNTLIFVRRSYLQMKSLNPKIIQQIINIQVMVASQQNFLNTFKMNQLLSFQRFMTPGESQAPWVLLVEQESYLSYMKKVIQKILQTIDPFYF